MQNQGNTEQTIDTTITKQSTELSVLVKYTDLINNKQVAGVLLFRCVLNSDQN